MVAATIAAIMLARSLPQEAMRAQRLREERLIMRGEQYSRAIELYFREHKKYPEELDDLEDTNGVRYLRRRYQDPITGEDEWRLIHMGANGRFKDSLIYDTENEESLDGTNRGIGGAAFRSRNPALAARASGNAYYNPNEFDGADRARQKRDSVAPDPLTGDDGSRGPNVDGLTDADDVRVGPDGEPLGPDYTDVRPGDVPEDAGQAPQPGQTPANGQQPQQQPQSPELAGSGAFRFQRRGRPPGLPPATGGGGAPQGLGRDAVAPEAANIIQRLLTTPRPGGLQGLRNQQAGAVGQAGQGGPQGFQEGVAGVASKAQRKGVKVYNDRETYDEWEFVYDYRKDQGSGAAAGMDDGSMTGEGLAPGQPGVTPSGLMGQPANNGVGAGVGGGVGAGVGAPPQSPRIRTRRPMRVADQPTNDQTNPQPADQPNDEQPEPLPDSGSPLYPDLPTPGQQQPADQQPQADGPFRLRNQRQQQQQQPTIPTPQAPE